MSFGSNILSYRDEIFRDIARLVAVPSVRDQAMEGMPYGKQSAAALSTVLKMAEEMGLKTDNVGGYAGHAEYGEGDTYAAVLTHVDVVPAGSGWATDPFTLTQKGSLWFGRGVADDKGEAIVALYCLKVLKDFEIPAKRKLRVIFGAGEETDVNGLSHYFHLQGFPVMGFTPDAEYGICNREKGILHVTLRAKPDVQAVREFHAGTAVNAVPDTAQALLACTGRQAEELERLAPGFSGRIEKRKDGSVHITTEGVAAHAMEPQLGRNAAALLTGLIAKVFSRQSGGLLSFLHHKIGMEQNGESLGIAMEDSASGPLTLNIGIVEINAHHAYAKLDIRYPVTCDGKQILETLAKQAESYGLQMEIEEDNQPLFLPEESKLVTLLKDAYREVMGEEPTLYATGGGTYARTIRGKGVAFGPFFPEEPGRHLHNADEHIDETYFMRHAQICLEAMYRMLTTE